MKMLRLCLLCMTALVVSAQSLWPCGGTPAPPCSRSVWLGKSVLGVAVSRPDGSAAMRIVLLPYAVWTTNNCPQPNGATLQLNIQCLQVGGGPAVNFPTVNVPVNTPSVPGAQQLAGGGNVFQFNAPAGSFAPNGVYVCRIQGAYTVGFPGSQVTGRGDAEACVLPASPVAADRPVINVQYVNPDGGPFQTCRRGDQAMMHFLIENNHPRMSATFDLSSLGRQTAGLPAGVLPEQAYDSLVHAISYPEEGTDVFPAAFADTMQNGMLLPEPDPFQVNPRQLDRTITLGPCEARVISIAVRSYGMCADGSCNERNLTLRGTWANGDSIVGCASTMLLVGSVDPKIGLCEYEDVIKADPNTDALFRSAVFNNANGTLEHAGTFYAGNLPPSQERGMQIKGENLASPDQPDFPPSATDYLRMTQAPTTVSYTLTGYMQSRDFVPVTNQVVITNIGAGEVTELPLIYGPFSLELLIVNYDAETDGLEIWDTDGNRKYQGTLDEFKESPPDEYGADVGTCRRFTKRGSLQDKWIDGRPPTFARLFVRTGTIEDRDSVRLSIPADEQWSAQVLGEGVVLERATGIGPVRFGYDVQALPSFPTTNLAVIEITCPGTLAPLRVPVFIRVKDFEDFMVEQVDFVEPFQQENSLQGVFSARFLPQSRIRFVNVFGRLPGETDPQWIVQNMPLMPFPEPEMISYWFDFGLFDLPVNVDIPQLEVSIATSDTVMTDPVPAEAWYDIDVRDLVYDVADGAPEGPVAALKIPRLPPIRWTTPLRIDTVYRGCTVPNIDLDSSRHNPGNTPGYAGDKNACGPAAAANSLQWLANTMEEIDSTRNHRDMMEELSKLMDRANERGVTTTQIAKGKLAYIDKYKLPISVKFQSKWFDRDQDVDSPDTTYRHKAKNHNASDNAWPTWDWLWGEVRHGEDVEILFGWYDTLGVRHGGHWVTVTGMINMGDSVRRVWVKDDLRQRDTGGTRQQILTWDSTASGIPVLRGWARTTRELRVESVVSESYDSTVRFDAVTPTLSRLEHQPPFRISPTTRIAFTVGTRPSDNTGFVNVLARRSESDAPVWVVRNMILPPFQAADTVTTIFDAGELGLQPGDQIDQMQLSWVVAEDIWTEAEALEDWRTLPVGTEQVIIREGLTDAAAGGPITNFQRPGPLTFQAPAAVDSVYRGCTIPNMDLDSARNNPVTRPGYAGDAGGCGPAGAANSMEWLQSVHPEINTALSHREKMEDLSRLMSRSNHGGVSSEAFIMGKLAFIDKYKLPISVKFQSREFGVDSVHSPDTTDGGGYGHYAHNRNAEADAEPTWSFLLNEMRDGEDVEMLVQWVDSAGRKAGGHIVTVSGVSNAAGPGRVWFKDDWNQLAKGGMRHTQATWDTANGRPIIRELSFNDTLCYVTGIVSESYDATVGFDTTVGGGTNSVPVVPGAPSGVSITVLNNPTDRGEITEIALTLHRPEQARVVVYDMLGRETHRLAERWFEPGRHMLTWNGRDGDNRPVAAGYYLVVFTTESGRTSSVVVRR